MSALKQEKKLSQYQVDVIKHLETNKNLIVEARAGSGKTSTIVEAIKSLPTDSRILCVAFNKKIAEELKERLPKHVQTNTINSLGHVLLRNYYSGESSLNMRKLEDTISEVISDKYNRDMVAQLVRGAVIYGYFPQKYNVDFGIPFAEIPTYSFFNYSPELHAVVDTILQKYVENSTTFDFDDQIYSTLALKISPKTKFDYIFVDEAQDLSFLKMKLTFKFLSETGKYIAIGDPMQAIYEFAGAQTESMNMIQKEMDCEVLKLPVCYRCPKEVVAEAQKFVPDIVAGNPDKKGIVASVSMDDFLATNFNPNTLILCRSNEPLFALAFKMFSHNRAFRFERFDMMKMQMLDFITSPRLSSIVDTISHYEQLKLEIFQDSVAEKDPKKKSKLMYQVNELAERTELLKTISIESRVLLVSELQRKIMELDCTKTGPLLSTVHKAKGLEADEVFILNQSLFNLKEQQEKNLFYVALTRSLKNLYFI